MRIVKHAARYIFAIVVFALILYLFDANDVLATLKGANMAIVAIGLALALATHLAAAIRLRHLLVMQGISLRLRQVFFISLSAVFYGLLIPGGTVAAFAARFVQLRRAAGVERIGAALVVDRLFATVGLLVVGAVTVAFDRAEQIGTGVIVVSVLLGAGALLFMRPLVAWINARLDGVETDESCGRWRKLWARVGQALRNYSTASRADVLRLVAASLTAHLFGCLMFYTIAVGVGLDLSFLSICWIRSGIILSTMIPVSVAGLGLRELTAIGLLVPLGFAQAQAVAYAILILLVKTVMVGIIGGVGELVGATSKA